MTLQEIEGKLFELLHAAGDIQRTVQDLQQEVARRIIAEKNAQECDTDEKAHPPNLAQYSPGGCVQHQQATGHPHFELVPEEAPERVRYICLDCKNTRAREELESQVPPGMHHPPPHEHPCPNCWVPEKEKAGKKDA